MGKRAHKRQRTEKPTSIVQPLGAAVSLLDDASKDEEERRLESALFGTTHAPLPKTAENILVVSDDDEQDDITAGQELQNLLDTDLFFVDDPNPLAADSNPDIDFDDSVYDQEAGRSSGEDEQEQQEEDDQEVEQEKEREPDEEDDVPTSSGHAEPAPQKSLKAPAWADPDDTTLQISLASNKRLRKLRDAPSEDTVRGREYERRLRRQYETINPTPDWATKARKKLGVKQKRRRSSVSEEDDNENDDISSLLASTGGILGRPRPKALPQGTIAIERLRDANQFARSEGWIKTVQFHPSPHIPMLLTASEDRRLRLFNIDGHTNPHLQTVHIPDLALTTANFHPSGTSILLTGPRPFYYTYDLETGTAQRSPRGLWGTTFSGANLQEGSMEICSFDPSGEILAVGGRRGYVHLVDWRSGAGQVVASVKMNSPVKGVWWARGQGGKGGELMSLGENAEVYVWDIAERRCVRRWKDDGGFGSHIIAGDRAGQYLGIGSRHGVVNMYGADATSSTGPDRPKPLKAIENLTTSISCLRFNHDSQLLAIASNTKKDQMRMIHLPSLTAFSNWPTSGTPLGHVTSVDFSTASEYAAVGNSRGRVLLYQLRDFVPQS